MKYPDYEISWSFFYQLIAVVPPEKTGSKCVKKCRKKLGFLRHFFASCLLHKCVFGIIFWYKKIRVIAGFLVDYFIFN